MPVAYLSPSLLRELTDVSVSPGAGIDGYSLTWNNTLGKWVAGATTATPAGVTGSFQINNNGALGSVSGLTYSGSTFTIPTNTNFRPATNSAINFQNTAGTSLLTVDTVNRSVVGPKLNQSRVALVQGDFSGKYAFKNGISLTDYSAFGEYIIYVNNGGELTIERLTASFGPTQLINTQISQDTFAARTNGFSFSPFSFQLNGTNTLIGSGRESGMYSPRTGDIALSASRADILISRSTSSYVSDAALPQRTFVGADSTPTAFLDIAAGTTATPSLRIRSGVAPTTPQDGAIWFDGTDLKMRIAGTTKTFQMV